MSTAQSRQHYIESWSAHARQLKMIAVVADVPSHEYLETFARLDRWIEEAADKLSFAEPSPPPPLRLEVGKTYRDRKGRVVEIIEEYPGDEYPFEDYEGDLFKPDGLYTASAGHDCDLIEEVTS